MSLPNLLEKILTKIIGNVSEDGFWHLGPFIRAGKQTYKLVNQDEVLKKSILRAMCVDLYEIKPGERCRNFFEKCLEAGNPDAIYFEGLHKATNWGDLEASVRVLQAIVHVHREATLATSYFCVCIGEPDWTSETFQLFVQHHESLQGDMMRITSEELILHLASFMPPYMNKYIDSFKFLDDDVIKMPDCAFEHDPAFERFCTSCDTYWFARRICNML